MINNTAEEYDAVITICKDLFIKKTKDYGTAWRILRPSSITDQIFIKAQRIRTLEEKKNIESWGGYHTGIHWNYQLLHHSNDAIRTSRQCTLRTSIRTGGD